LIGIEPDDARLSLVVSPQGFSCSWKAVWIPSDDAKWSLYNLATDAGETKDLADASVESVTSESKRLIGIEPDDARLSLVVSPQPHHLDEPVGF
jgi:mRNA-degrading endonuclease toxin of MazEF toxin-antitoxin module